LIKRGSRPKREIPPPDYAAPVARVHDLESIVAVALAEDVRGRDVTADAVVPQGTLGLARITQKQAGVLFGFDAVAETLRQCGIEDLERLGAEGEWRDSVPAPVATATGPAASLLAAERTALNFLGHLSGVATLTARFVEAVAGTGAHILDTRKTTPGLRAMEKYAVRCGGGTNKRMGLYDVAMIKDNHKLAAGSLTAAYRAVRAKFPDVDVQVEATTPEEAEEAIRAGARFLLCDNMTPQVLADTVRRARAAAGGERVELEATGGLTLEAVAEYATTGVDYLSVGGLTHSSPVLDLAMDLITD